MQSITAYPKDTHIRLLLQGPPGSGKSCVGCQFPGVYVADCDVNLAGPLRFLQREGLALPVGYDTIDMNDGAPVPLNQRFDRLLSCINIALKEPKVETIMLDSCTRITDYIRDKVTGVIVGDATVKSVDMDWKDWGTYFVIWKQFIGKLVAQPKHIVVLAHETVETDNTTQHLKHFISIPGQFRFLLGAFFTDIWRCEVQPPPLGTKEKHKFVVRTMPDNRYNLKNSFGLPTTMKFDWSIIEKALAQ